MVEREHRNALFRAFFPNYQHILHNEKTTFPRTMIVFGAHDVISFSIYAKGKAGKILYNVLMSVSSNSLTNLQNIFAYIKHLIKRRQGKPTLNIEAYKKSNADGVLLKDVDLYSLEELGIEFPAMKDIHTDIWLIVPRVQRTQPPTIPENVERWMVENKNNNPLIRPSIEESIAVNMTREEAEANKRRLQISDKDIREPEENWGNGLCSVTLHLEQLPREREAVEAYLQTWDAWAEREKPRYLAKHIYQQLFNLRQTIERDGDKEVVWGSGMVFWHDGQRRIILPLLEKVVRLELLDDNRILIRNTDKPLTFPQLAFDALELPDTLVIRELIEQKETMLSEEFSPHHVDTYQSILDKAVTIFSADAQHYSKQGNVSQQSEWPEVTEIIKVTDHWAVYSRKPRIDAIAKDINEFERKVHHAAAESNISLLSRFVLSPADIDTSLADVGSKWGKEYNGAGSDDESPLYFPKPYNEAQQRIIQGLQNNEGIVVQGPPGTGKTHTIANIICHYLAEGKRILVTSHKEPALTVLREQIPQQLRPVAVSMFASDDEGQNQLEEAVRFLKRIDRDETIDALTYEIAQLNHRVKDKKDAIYATECKVKSYAEDQMRPVPTYLVDAINSLGIQGAQPSPSTENMIPSELASIVGTFEQEDAWFPDGLKHTQAYQPKFTQEDLQTLNQARKVLAKNIKYVHMAIPSVEELPSAKTLHTIHKQLCRRAKLYASMKQHEIPEIPKQTLDAVNYEEFSVLVSDIFTFHAQLSQEKGMDIIFKRFLRGNPAPELLELMDGLHRIAKESQQHTVPIAVSDPGHLLEDVKKAVDKYCAGKNPFGPFSFGAVECKQYVKRIMLRGRPPQTPQDWQEVKKFIRFQEQVRKFNTQWEFVAEHVPLPKLTFRYGASHKHYKIMFDNLRKAQSLAKRWEPYLPIAATLRTKLEPCYYPLYKNALQYMGKALKNNIVYYKLASYEQKLEGTRKYLTDLRKEVASPALKLLQNVGVEATNEKALVKRWNDYVKRVQFLNQLQPHMATLKHGAALIDQSGAPLLAKILETQPFVEGEPYSATAIWSAWQRNRARSYLKSIGIGKSQASYERERRLLDEELKKTFAALVLAKAKLGLLRNLTDRVKSALTQVVQAMEKIGKGTGKRAPRHRAEMRQAMGECVSAVPCWIMTVARISEILPRELASFDLVIIDEASQSDITAFPAILRAKKLLVVGDDKQVSPISFDNEGDIKQAKQQFLSEHPFAEQLLPPSSIYDLAMVVFPSQTIMLTEHFRCVEPIIRFSMQFYGGDLCPLRLPKASERLDPPLVDVYVPLGRRGERGNKKQINEEEVQGIVDEIKHITHDPTYAGRTIGVISLTGDNQARAIQDALLSTLGEQIFRRFKIACGDATTFQGRERDIIFLSMVVGPERKKALTGSTDQRRFNVALSRARDRMYLYHSITLDHVDKVEDMRRKTLEHFQHPMPDAKVVEDALELCDSEFERDVYKRLVDRGYKVTPQVRVGRYSIDLVVEDGDNRLAIELDGEKYHPPEKWQADWKRQRDMERVGWTFWRCWGSNYYLDPDGCMVELITELEKHDICPTYGEGKPNPYVEYRTYRSNEGFTLLDGPVSREATA